MSHKSVTAPLAAALMLLLLVAVDLCEGRNPKIDAFDRKVCGKRARYYPKYLDRAPTSNRMSDGWYSAPGEFPWHVQIGGGDSGSFSAYEDQDCGGVIIHHNLIVTAAHCVDFEEPGIRARSVVAGIYDIRDNQTWQINFYTHLINVYFHPKYKKPVDPSAERFQMYDVAVIKLGRSFTYNDYVRPACLWDLASDTDSPHKYCVAAGFGQSNNDSSSNYSRMLALPMKVDPCDEAAAHDEGCWVAANKKTFPGMPCMADKGAGLYCLNEDESAYYLKGVATVLLDAQCISGIMKQTLFYEFWIGRSEFEMILHDVLGKDFERNFNPEIDAYDSSICGTRSRVFPNHTEKHARDWFRSAHYGDKLIRDRIASGWPAKAGEFPWHVFIRTEYVNGHSLPYDCGGVLIHENLILTAARCVHHPTVPAIHARFVMAGFHDIKDPKTVQVATFSPERDVIYGEKHKEVPMDDLGFSVQDIAIIRTLQPFEYNDYVQPACLSDSNYLWFAPHSNCVATGAGRTGTERENNWKLDKLRAIPMKEAYYCPFNRKDEACWEPSNPQAHMGRPCQGDVGSGLYCLLDNAAGTKETFYVFGIYVRGLTNRCVPGENETVVFSDLWVLRKELNRLIYQALNPSPGIGLCIGECR